ncbi:type II secretion system F family protein [Roseisalinus antarcticus]|uniref:Bacterial type II secretion system protein F domain protein n=1 Tax=Roseisalinus antarcticus TaxID=254357 RepID=A0A1Y5SXF4_9RHOB|nr:type II secretion system F family protein [Roseisalinus antarcticus]SLN50733.1 Bacterial type II secretion system protein F domain protein [Roseisalinus antarcticus]
MEYIDAAQAYLTETLGPLGPLIAVGGLGVVLILLTLPIMLKKQDDPLDRLRRSQDTESRDLIEATRLRQKKGTDKLDKFSNFLEPQDKAEYSAVQLKLLQAGYRTKNAVRLYHFAQFALGILFLLGGVAYAILQTQTGEPTTQATMLSIILPGAAGYMLPKYWVNKRQQERTKEIENGFPDSLDMMLVCVEAGQSLDQAIIRVAKELKTGFPALSWEYELVAYEMKAGKDKTSVLKDMAERCGVPDVSSFVTVLVQSQQFGTSIADALRIYAAEMRDKRVMRAEEKANTLPTKMTLATMMLTVPPLLIILIGPSVFDIYENLVLGAAAP